MKNILSNFYYNKKASYLFGNFDFFECMEVLKKYDKFETLPVLPDTERYIVPCRDWIYTIKDRTESIFDLYFKNLHFHLENNDNGKIIRVYLKKAEDDWILSKKGANFDPTNPDNKSIEIYRWFNIIIYEEHDIERERFMEGEWNKEVTLEMEEMSEIIEKFTDLRQISDSYKKKDKIPTHVAGKL